MPEPLPAIIPFSNFNNWDRYLDALYQIYMDELVNAQLTFNGLPIRYRFKPPTNDKGFGFWHIISEGDKEDDRLPSFERCEKIRWIPWMIQEFGEDPDIVLIHSDRGSSKNVVLWNMRIHYAVILSERNGYYLLLSAYPTTVGRERSFKNELKD